VNKLTHRLIKILVLLSNFSESILVANVQLVRIGLQLSQSSNFGLTAQWPWNIQRWGRRQRLHIHGGACDGRHYKQITDLNIAGVTKRCVHSQQPKLEHHLQRNI